MTQSTAAKPQVPPRHAATIVQGGAADPQRHVWVGASAGTGKTKVLIDRVLRLMLPRRDGQPATPPGRILCLTFTKTGAAEMSNRIYAMLGQWSVMDDAALDAALTELTGGAPDAAMTAAARRLFAQVLDAPGGLKIMTIHSFCQSVLKRFPIEAGLPPHFALMDELTARDVLTQCLHDLIADTGRHPDTPLARSFTQLSLRLDAAGLTDILQKMMAERAKLEAVLTAQGDTAGSALQTVTAIYTRLGLDPVDTLASIAAQMLTPHAADEKELRSLARAVLDHGTDALQIKGRAIADWLAGDSAARSALLPLYLDFFFKKDGDRREKFVTKDVKGAMPDAEDVASREANRLDAVIARQRALRLAEGTAALLTVSADMLARYARVKKDRDALDFDDLILRTAALLTSSADVQWVLYKLDGGIDHILVDEAQDTSPVQWNVVAALAGEFFGGAGARHDAQRTLFVVGDEKQSIFSFQGADPAAFHRMKSRFAELSAALQEGFAVDLEYSFRSTASVLGLVDAIFNCSEAKAGVVMETDKPVVHLPFRLGHAGHVELWPLFKKQDAMPRDSWQPAVSLVSADNAMSRLAQQIAETIRGWLDRGDMLEARGRPIRAGDVMILVQGRNGVERLMRALKAESIPVAGADRMKLRQEIAVMDMLAAASFGLQPRDDLTLATLLKSPLVGIDEDTLFTLCHGRGQKTLWSHIHDTRPDLAQWLQPLVATAGRATPYEFFASLLTMPCPGDSISGRRAFYGRLGRDVADALNEFLNGCLGYEQSHIPSLQAFNDWFARNESDIKREQDAAGIDQVRIMTVHASKGLQAPIVFLPDTTKILHAHNKGRVRLAWGEDDGDVPLWAPAKADETADFTERYEGAATRQDEEYRRLLYVALTRAEDRLYIAGVQGKYDIRPQCWYRLVESAFPDTETREDGVRVLRHAQTVPVLKEKTVEMTAPAPRLPLPDWARVAAEPEEAPSKPLAPSRPGEDEPAVKSPLAGDDKARFARGVIMHRLLEVLPGLDHSRREGAMRAYLARPAFHLSAEQQQSFAAEIAEVLAHPDFAAIFGPGSRAEVPLVGIAGKNADGTVVIAGQVDRLLVADDEILIVDYKTNRPPPQDVKDVPAVYLKQMAAYMAVLSRIYPGRRISTALLWTDGPRLMPLPLEMLEVYAPKAG